MRLRWLVFTLSLIIAWSTSASEPATPQNTYFTLAVLPDTQYYARDNSGIFEAQIHWIVRNADRFNR